VPIATANKPTTPTMNAVSFVDMLESLLKVDGQGARYHESGPSARSS
jgi:hypothetical protein